MGSHASVVGFEGVVSYDDLLRRFGDDVCGVGDVHPRHAGHRLQSGESVIGRLRRRWWL